MDGDAVNSDSPSDSEHGFTVPKTFTEVFIKVFPQYMVMGMTYEQFWRGPAWLARAYMEAYRIKGQNEEWARWRQGAYIYDALLRVAPVMRAAFGKGRTPEPGKYPNRPWPLTEKEAREQEAAERQQRFERFMAMLNKESEETLKNQRKESDETKVVGEDARHRESDHTDQRE